MSKVLPTQTSNPTRTVKKVLLSSAVVVTFAIYALHQRQENAAAAGNVVVPASVANNNNSGNFNNSGSAFAANQSQPQPTSIPASTGKYRDGAFTGVVADAYYGLVQVKVTIQGGKITDVQFLDYPHDRRTSQEINSQAMPWLQQETIQAQSEYVNIISGATLTSEAFGQSLQSALNQARG